MLDLFFLGFLHPALVHLQNLKLLLIKLKLFLVKLLQLFLVCCVSDFHFFHLLSILVLLLSFLQLKLLVLPVKFVELVRFRLFHFCCLLFEIVFF